VPAKAKYLCYKIGKDLNIATSILNILRKIKRKYIIS